jgi:type I restriction enzyme M protein
MERISANQASTSENPWRRLPYEPPYVLPEDAEAVEAFNTQASDIHRLRVRDILPEPFVGRPNAPVLLLSTNPGFVESDHKHEGDFFARMRANLLHQPLAHPLVFLAPDNPQRLRDWWDPACGTGGFLLGAYDYVVRHHGGDLDKDQKKHLRTNFVKGWELVPNTARLGIMNLYLHGIDPGPGKAGDPYPCPIRSGVDSLLSPPGEQDKCSLVLTNPPFGKKSTITIVNEAGELEKEDASYERQDFWTTTKNKQLNFVQHVKSLLKVNGRCAIVVPDNVLFEGGAGEKVRTNLLRQFDVHTLLRLPTGIFYAQGVKANVLFFDAKPAREQPWTSKLWVYDLRTNMHFTLKTNPLQRSDLDEFVDCYKPDGRHKRKPTWSEKSPDGRWRAFEYDELVKRDKVNLDIFWLKDQSLEDSDDLPKPDVLAEEIADDLEAALEQFTAIAGKLKNSR